jgi:pimeloyl-ACP methyl ester carboxylesterase
MMPTVTRHAIDRTVALDINGSRQRIRLCAERDERSPLLIVQGGPGLPLLNEVPKFQRLLDLEREFLVGYWEQRGCGNAPSRETESVSLRQASPPRVAAPVHYVSGENDALNPPAIVNRLPATIAAPVTSVTIVPDAGHMVHLDHPDVVRTILVKA